MTNSELVKIIKHEIEKSSYLDIGEGVELKLGVSKEQLEMALKSLEKEGYKIHHITIKQATNPSKENSIPVMSKDRINSDYIRVIA